MQQGVCRLVDVRPGIKVQIRRQRTRFIDDIHRALCREAGYIGPLNRCSIYGNKKAGEKYQAMLAMGTSRPWNEALKAVTGEEQMDATAILDYFAPLKVWLDAQNKELSKE